MNPLDELIKAVQDGVEQVREHLGPDEDWEPILFLLNEGEGSAICPLGQLMTDAETKELLSERIIPSLIQRAKAHTMVLLLSTWMVMVEAKTPEGESLPDEEVLDMLVPPSQHPRRVENLVLICADQDEQHMLRCEITRPEGAEHPVLGEWTRADMGKKGASYSGRFWEAPLAALREEKS